MPNQPMTSSIYRSPEAARAVARAYRAGLGTWTVPYKELDVPTGFGSVRVIVAGPDTGPPVVLCHPRWTASPWWSPTVAPLVAAGFRTYAVDHIGDVGMSVLDDPAAFPSTPEQTGRLYSSIADHLGVDRCAVVGASDGGHVAMRFALDSPGRVDRLALLAPLGLTRLPISVTARRSLALRRPSPRRRAGVRRRVLGPSPAIPPALGAWFDLVMRSVAPPSRVARPVVLRPEELRALGTPVLLVLGDRDHLVGFPGRAARRAAPIRDLRVEVLRAGHLLHVERPSEVERVLLGFLSGSAGQGGSAP